MTDTCNFPKCAVAKKLKIKKAEECINFTSAWWRPEEGKPVLLNDCAPKRMPLMIQELYNRMTGVQKSQEEQRNALQPLGPLLDMAKGHRQKVLTEDGSI